MGEWLGVGGGGLACHCSPSLGDKLTFTHAARLGEQAEAGWRHRLSLKAGVDCLPHEPGHLPKYPHTHTHTHTEAPRHTHIHTDNGRGDDVLSMPTKCGIVAQALSLACSLSNRLSVCVCVCVRGCLTGAICFQCCNANRNVPHSLTAAAMPRHARCRPRP